MAPFVRTRTACKYASDRGPTFRFRVLDSYLAQEPLGWVAADSITQEVPPKGMKPRVALCWLAADHSKRRRVVVATAAAYDALVPGTTAISVDVGGVLTEYICYEREGERNRGKELD